MGSEGCSEAIVGFIEISPWHVLPNSKLYIDAQVYIDVDVDVDVDIRLKYVGIKVLNMNNVMLVHMELKRINVMVPEDIHEILDRFQKKHGHRSKDKALAELLKAFEDCEKNRDKET